MKLVYVMLSYGILTSRRPDNYQKLFFCLCHIIRLTIQLEKDREADLIYEYSFMFIK